MTNYTRYIIPVLVLYAWNGTVVAQDSNPTVLSAEEEQVLLAELASAAQRNGGTEARHALISSAFRAAFGQGTSIDSDDQFASDRGGATFTWVVPERYDDSWRAWDDLRTVEVSEPVDHDEYVYGYLPSFVHPSAWPVILDGCATKIPDNSAAQFSWIIRREGKVVVEEPHGACFVVMWLPQAGYYDVTLEAASQGGWRDSATGRINVNDLLIISLGDSMASGEGNPDDEALDVGWDGVGWVDRRCHRSKTSGHALAARALEQHSSQSSVTFLSFACSGAQLAEGVLAAYAGQSPMAPSKYGPSAEWQVRDLDSQIAAAREALCTVPVDKCGPEQMRQPDFIFVSAGVNDLGFGTVLKACANLELTVQDALMLGVPYLDDFLGDSCDESVGVENLIADGFYSLTTKAGSRPPDGRFTFGELRRRLNDAGIRPRDGVYLTTYPGEPFASGTCFAFTNIDGGEVDYLHATAHRLNTSIHLEAIGNGFFSVPGITAAFEGHSYCSPSSYWVTVQESLMNQLGLDGPLHPNRPGHEAIRDAYLAAIASPKPDRQPTHRVTLMVQRVRFDLPAYPEISGTLEFGLVPYEVVENDELAEKAAPVVWKRVFKTEEVAAIKPGKWIEFAEPITLEADAAPADHHIIFNAGAIVKMVGGPEGGVLQRLRVPTTDRRQTEDDVLDPDRGDIGFYVMPPFYGSRSDGQSNYGSGRYQRRGELDLGGPGSMTIEFCVVASPIDTGPRFPVSDAATLGCPAQILRD